MLLALDNVQIPKGMIPFEKAKNNKFSKRQYIYFYMHDKYFSDILTATNKYVDLLKQYDGIITPDYSMVMGRSKCIQQTNTYFNRAVGFYLQRQGVPVIANIRWSDENSFEYCFLGVLKHAIVSVSTHGCIRSRREKEIFRAGLIEMIRVLEPTDVLVHGYMPKIIFDNLEVQTRFHRYPSLFEQTHMRKNISGNGI